MDARAPIWPRERLRCLDLDRPGLRVLMDVTDRGRGFFAESPLERFAHPPNSVIVLSPHAMDRYADKNGWLPIEIAHAITGQRWPGHTAGDRYRSRKPPLKKETPIKTLHHGALTRLRSSTAKKLLDMSAPVLRASEAVI